MPTREQQFLNGEGSLFSEYRIRQNNYVQLDEVELTPVYDEIILREIQRDPIEKEVKYKKYTFYSFYHAHVCTMIKQLNRYGIEGLLDPAPDSDNGDILRRQQGTTSFNFNTTYKPVESIVNENRPEEGFDFDFDGPYGIYNWELFFHTPLTIATRLSQNQKFEEAQKWFHYIFNPTETEGAVPQRYWKVKPFFEHEANNSIADVLQKMKSGDEAFNRQLNQWMKSPFNPHIIARLRTVAYMKTVVMKYVDNLIAWADNLFRRDSIESINEATQLYVLAAQILGPKPQSIEKEGISPRKIKDIVDNVNSFSNAHIRIEDEIGDIETGDEEDADAELNSLNSILYFCTSPNDKLLAYWDTVADRLFKIRNCQNIEGITRSLALFEPPIDPALLVRASAAGLDIGQVLNTISGASLPYYRFRVLIQKAIELCNDVKSLGASLLSALEKKDAEELSQLRSRQEVTLLKSVRQVRQRNIQEAEENIASLENAKELTEIRREFYSTQEYMNQEEQVQLKKLEKALDLELLSHTPTVLAGVLAAIPEITSGVSGAFGSPHVVLKFLAGSETTRLMAQALQILSNVESQKATASGIKGSYNRRQDEWDFQTELAEKELEQIDKQITAAQIRLAVAERELQNHDLQTEQAEEVEFFMKNKFTNQELYNWMVTQLSGMYFQSYQLAYEVARMAEQAFQFELAKEDSFFIEFGHWDSLRKGLLSGERLERDLRRMEVAYLEQNKREYELRKSISLALLAPDQLVNLRENGACDIYIPEVLFDMDYPGQYLRRIKSVRLSVPAVTGPYTNVNAKLTLLSNRYRKSPRTNDAYAYAGINDERFRHNMTGIQSIATSSAQNDAGLFELNFQDERYLPFEGAGAISSWRLELTSDFRQFDYDTISDVVIQMDYMAREGGETLKSAANANIREGLNRFSDQLEMNETGLYRLFSLKTNLPNSLYSLTLPLSGQSYQQARVEFKAEHFPNFLNRRELELRDNLTIIIKFRDNVDVDPTTLDVTLAGSAAGALGTATFINADANFSLPYANLTAPASTPIDEWLVRITANSGATSGKVNTDTIEDIYILVNYTVQGAITTPDPGDQVPPSFTTAPAAANILDKTVDISFTVGENSNIYALAVPDGATAPTAQEIIAQGTGILAMAGEAESFTVSELTAVTAYDIYVMAVDSKGNVSGTTQLDVTTTAATGEAFFNFCNVAQSIAGYNDAPGNPHVGVIAINDASTGIIVRSAGSWFPFGAGTSFDGAGEDTDDGGGFAFDQQVQNSYWFSRGGSPIIEINGLNDADTYTIELLASRETVGETRVNEYGIGGDNISVTVTGNTSNTHLWTGMSPTGGRLQIDAISKVGEFYYFNVLRVIKE